MKTVNPWILPDGIEEMLPADARSLEALRRRLLDTYYSWGYDLIMPPLVEFKESLLTGVGLDLDSQTLSMTDRISGRTLGVRADISPQAARIDAHSISGDEPRRLCYCGTVLKAVPDGPERSRSPIQIGAELFGVDDLSGDAEIIRLMLTSLKLAGVENITLDLGNVTLYTWVEEQVRREIGDIGDMFSLVQDKRLPELQAWVAESGLSNGLADLVTSLPRLAGNSQTLKLARSLFAEAPHVLVALNELDNLADIIRAEFPDVRLFFDLGELRGAHYHTGVVFAAYTPGYGSMLANGGRYNEVGRAFGKARPATGFSADLKTLLRTGNFSAPKTELILASGESDPELEIMISQLREDGMQVIRAGGEVTESVARELGVGAVLIKDKSGWQKKSLKAK